MFRSETERDAADLFAALDIWDRDLARLEQLLRARHPETLSVRDFAEMRRDFLTHLSVMRRFIDAQREALYGRSDPPGHYRG